MNPTQRKRPKPIFQASVIPYRRTPRGWEFCLITSIRRQKWGFPKGIIDPGETFAEAARKEAQEEAGLGGPVDDELLGEYRDHKWGRDLLVQVGLMKVTTVAPTWLEQDLRERRWVGAAEAQKLLRGRGHLLKFLERAVERLDSPQRSSSGEQSPD